MWTTCVYKASPKRMRARIQKHGSCVNVLEGLHLTMISRGTTSARKMCFNVKVAAELATAHGSFERLRALLMQNSPTYPLLLLVRTENGCSSSSLSLSGTF